ncbi:hypothetical protein DOTSEDRAFT_135263 [Dothistroma septosporum NZE10]|uniref:Uncharacterized protein n=1 Tax=Dothistroma septosporum (strain NZE10 / CBS 128990) TaxID=675120 RepID=N1PK56_DOTSN|nr:hypothetical protein DOTSEDRAFT_135263 [Dothistroma septosporum NZE10]
MRYPRTPADVDGAILWLSRASNYKLPPELLKVILPQADYDSIRFHASADHAYTESSDGPETTPMPYLETCPLRYLDKINSETPCRIRRLHLEVSGRDQGWVTAQDGKSWSWFELGKRKTGGATGTEEEVERGLVWCRNPVAGIQYKEQKLTYDADDHEKTGEALQEWVQGLENGDKIAIVPMARFGGWECNVRRARIEVEVEVWR